jgi:DNA-binding CsgD family transcriptional regulator
VEGLLFDRTVEISRLTRGLEEARAGRGNAMVVTGAAGIGKTALLSHTARLAEGMVVLKARGAELERTYPFGVVRQLFDRPLRRAQPDPRFLSRAADPAPDLAAPAEQEALMRIYWRLAEIAEGRPALVVVDDVQWADESSLRWIAFLANRLSGLPVALLVAGRSGETDSSSLRSMLRMRHVHRLALGPLGTSAAGELIAHATGHIPHTGFVRACAVASGGNPLLLKTLVTALLERGVAPDASGAAAVATTTSAELDEFVRGRLEQLPDTARELAQALAILGPDTTVRDASELGGLPFEAGAAAADELRRAELCAPQETLAFLHPLLAGAVHATIPLTRRGLMHARAARLLDGVGAPVERVAGQLLHSEPAGDPWVVDRLRAAAQEAMGRGSPSSAVTLLRRATREGVCEDRATLHEELGWAEALVQDPAAFDDLFAAVRLASSDRERARRVLVVGRALLMSGQLDRGLSLLEPEIEALGGIEDELGRCIAAELYSSARLVPGWAESVSATVRSLPEFEGSTPGERGLLACMAGEMACNGGDAARAIELATRALAEGTMLEECGTEAPVFLLACETLNWCGAFAEAARHLSMAMEVARRRGSMIGFAHASGWLAESALGRGEIRRAEAYATDTLLALPESYVGVEKPLALAWSTLCLLEQGRLDEAQRQLAASPWGAVYEGDGGVGVLLYARGRLELAHGDPGRALASFEACGAGLLRDQAPGPSVVPWRTGVAIACLRLGDGLRAAAVADEQVQRARRFGAHHSVGLALAAAAVAGPADERIERLREASAHLARSEARLLHAHCLHELGASLRRAGLRRDAREPLRQSLDLAVRCGASALERRNREELSASGAKPRRTILRGPDSLTPAELRVSELAAQGMSNRQIGQELFVTLKTVETHLHHSFEKLGIRSRHELAETLGCASAVSVGQR